MKPIATTIETAPPTISVEDLVRQGKLHRYLIKATVTLETGTIAATRELAEVVGRDLILDDRGSELAGWQVVAVNAVTVETVKKRKYLQGK